MERVTLRVQRAVLYSKKKYSLLSLAEFLLEVDCEAEFQFKSY
jgi:hypothetical protein